MRLTGGRKPKVDESCLAHRLIDDGRKRLRLRAKPVCADAGDVPLKTWLVERLGADAVVP